jgi:hypothetical protein
MSPGGWSLTLSPPGSALATLELSPGGFEPPTFRFLAGRLMPRQTEAERAIQTAPWAQGNCLGA